MAADGIRQRSRQFTASQQARNPFHDDGEFQKIIRKGPIFLAICLLVGVPFGKKMMTDGCVRGLP
jgi:hypothetical protein